MVEKLMFMNPVFLEVGRSRAYNPRPSDHIQSIDNLLQTLEFQSLSL